MIINIYASDFFTTETRKDGYDLVRSLCLGCGWKSPNYIKTDLPILIDGCKTHSTSCKNDSYEIVAEWSEWRFVTRFAKDSSWVEFGSAR